MVELLGGDTFQGHRKTSEHTGVQDSKCEEPFGRPTDPPKSTYEVQRVAI